MIGILISLASLNARPAQRSVVPALGLLCVLLTAGAAAAQTQPRTAATSIELSNALQATVRLVTPAVVQIFATSYTPGEGVLPHASDLVSTQRASGSGVIVDPNGYIVTNAHVVRGAQRLLVELPTAASGQVHPRNTKPHCEPRRSSGSTSRPIWRSSRSTRKTCRRSHLATPMR